MPPANPPSAAVPSRPAPPSSLAPSAGGIAAVPPVAGASNQGLAPDEAALPAVGGAQELYTLSFSWDRPTAAAAFRRAGFLWVVFDRHQQADIRALQVTGGKAVSFAEQVEVGPTATAVRFVVDPAFNPSFRREGLLWIMDLQRQPLRPRTPIEVSPQPRSPVGPRLYLPVSDGGSVVTVQDPEVGDSIIVVPVLPLGAGIYPARAYPDATLPVTAQGVVVEPVSQGVSVRSSRQGVEITAAGGLRLSSDGERVAAAARLGASGGEVSAIFDIPRWRGNQEAPVFERRNQMLEAVGMAPASRRNDARMEMARFYFANGYGAEALGVLRTILAADPEFENRASFRAIRGGAEFLMGRYGDAVNDLAHPSLAGVDEAAFWRAAAQASLGNPAAQAGILEATSGVLADYPDDLRVPLALVAAEAAIAAANDLAARTFLEAANVPDVTRHQKAERLYFEGLMKETSGDFDGALQAYQQAEDEGSMKWTPHARRKRLELEHQLGRLPVDDLIQGLQRLRYAWRGDDFEFTLLRRLADLNLEKGDYGEALRGMKLVATYFDQRPEVAEITDQMLRVFEDLYLRGGADALSPITAIALYDEFRELTPAGQKGDEMIRKLADRLVKVDLLEQAAGLLDRQIQTRLKTPGEERARIGARLGLVRLLNGQPEAALNALLATGADGLSPDLAAHRSHLAARALADMGRANEAIARLDGDTTKDARILRSEIFWKAQNWPEAARTISELVPPPERGKTMAAEDARRVLDWATALTLAGDDPQAALLRRRYLDAMKDTDVFEAFDLITSPGDRGLPDYRTINEKVAQADSFRSFLSSYRDRMKTEGLSGLN
ncbi:tetratricopeptide repeat protein [Rhodospirillum rubrum]|uniref:tetratricopeptide repeat protein n=1 Tax=Rhodospirillum rubrum TaxID=1085 RepID=UPI0028AD3C85|nr:tetratricopeptide repeat protein [Rhodospirillum rubrum]